MRASKSEEDSCVIFSYTSPIRLSLMAIPIPMVNIRKIRVSIDQGRIDVGMDMRHFAIPGKHHGGADGRHYAYSGEYIPVAHACIVSLL